MNNHASPALDTVFGALADPTRRSILARLAQGEASVSELTEPFDISQPAISKHLKVLEAAGLVERDSGHRAPARLKATPMKNAVRWLEEFERFWTGSFNELDQLLSDLKSNDRKDTP